MDRYAHSPPDYCLKKAIKIIDSCTSSGAPPAPLHCSSTRSSPSSPMIQQTHPATWWVQYRTGITNASNERGNSACFPAAGQLAKESKPQSGQSVSPTAPPNLSRLFHKGGKREKEDNPAPPVFFFSFTNWSRGRRQDQGWWCYI